MADVSTLSLFKAKEDSVAWMYHICSVIHLLIDPWVASTFGPVQNAAVSSDVQVSVSVSAFGSFGHTPEGGTAGR